MNRSRMRFRSAGAILLLTGLVALSACQQATSEGDTEESIDRDFIDMMVPHHEAAVAMAELALERAERDELLDMAQDITETQSAEIAQMRAWREDWFGSAETPGMEEMPLLPGMSAAEHGGHGETMDMAAEVEALRDAEPFDRAFLDSMVAHHQDAIDAAQIAIEESERSEIRELATEIIDAQQREIDQLLAWREEWYQE